jgi:hypothetical protein
MAANDHHRTLIARIRELLDVVERNGLAPDAD